MEESRKEPEHRRFTMIDEEFTCTVCGFPVPRLGYTARDHCPSCLFSLHLDIHPGDRMCGCRGILEPVSVENYRQKYKIIYRCKKCKAVKRNIMADDDNMEEVIRLSSMQQERGSF